MPEVPNVGNNITWVMAIKFYCTIIKVDEVNIETLGVF
jgi:hypothetical protein